MLRGRASTDEDLFKGFWPRKAGTKSIAGSFPATMAQLSHARPSNSRHTVDPGRP
jgi:hypothetical protein